MKILKKVVAVGFFVLLCTVFCISASASGTDKYTVVTEGDEYVLYSASSQDGHAVMRSTVLGELINAVLDASDAAEINFYSVITDDSIVISGGSYTFCGGIEFTEGAGLTVDGGSLSFAELKLKLVRPIRIKRGEVRLLDGDIISDGTAVSLDYSSLSSFEMSGGYVASASEAPTVEIKYGSAAILGGKIENTLGSAINSSSTLMLGGTPEILGATYGIITENPVTLTASGLSFRGSVSVKYSSSFSDGSITAVFYNATRDTLRGITLYDADGIRRELTYFDNYHDLDELNFGAVYLPYTVRFFSGEELIRSEEYLKGEYVKSAESINRAGYEFLGWSALKAGGEFFEFSAPVSGDVDLYASYKLLPPTYEISSISFVYDGGVRRLTVDELMHPCLGEGMISYHWYKDGYDTENYGEYMPLRAVSDSGSYSCVLTFTVDGQSVSTTTAAVEAIIEKCAVPIPTPTAVYYNGKIQYPDVVTGALYTVEEAGGTLAGTYPVAITLRDNENYAFVGSDKATVYADFIILKADNGWREQLTVKDVYSGSLPSPYSSALFGEVIYLYADAPDAVFSEEVPTVVGEYCVKAAVVGNENYSGLVSEAVAFKIIAEEVVGLAVLNSPNKSDYVAFEGFDAEGLTVGVTYNSSRTTVIDGAAVKVVYDGEEWLRYGDSAVVIEYGGCYASIAVRVARADYDMSGIFFSDGEVEFNGELQSLNYIGELPTGADGIRLTAKVLGGGKNVGKYVLRLVFASESEQYNIPEEMTAALTVLPRSVTATWDNTEFVYDGSIKSPSAYYCDVYGRKVVLAVSGARSYAGSYTAAAVPDDGNYSLLNGECAFVVHKADYDMTKASWSFLETVYDGTEKKVVLTSLPVGVSVIGYSDNKGTDSGQYKATATLSFDERNYNPPTPPVHIWTVLPAEYSLDEVSFSDVVVEYNGEEQFPQFTGSMPVGADGIMLEYTYGKGVTNVSEGKCAVEIRFSTNSKNYVVPDAMTAYVTVTPKPIEVIWTDLEFTYNGEGRLPVATAKECEVMVSGAATDAGEYTASATALDTNYAVTNSSALFVIHKAQNGWVLAPEMEDVYFGHAISPSAIALGGEVEFYYYTDSSCNEKIDVPTEVGRYFIIAYTKGDGNYLPISSEPLEFSILKVLPTGMTVSSSKDKYIALDIILPDDFSLVLNNNDGSCIEIDEREVGVEYANGECIYYGDSYVTLSYLDFEARLDFTVDKRKFDTSAVRWEGLAHTYDKAPKNAILTGLPEGITVSSYVGCGGIAAGEYTVSAIVSYDEKNYYPPELPSAIMRINKQLVPLPAVEPLVYCGSLLTPSVPSSALYTFSFEVAVFAGEYSIELSLTDADNYEFEGGNARAVIPFEVIKRRLKVQVCDVSLYRFWELADAALSYTIIEGEVVSGDALACEYISNGDKITAIFSSPNYDVEVLPGRIIHVNRMSQDGRRHLLLLVFSLIALALIIVAVILNRRRLYRYYREALCRAEKQKTVAEPFLAEASNCSEPVAEAEVEVPCDSEENSEDNSVAAVPIDADYADSAISDTLARSLIRKDEFISTKGNRRGIVNVDTLSRSFCEGDRVDINILKQRSLIPYDTGYIKVLARGIIDKPLTVYANDFSLSAVKMIALAGGKAVKVKSVIEGKNGK